MTLFSFGLPSFTPVAGILPVRTQWMTPADIPDTVDGLFQELVVASAPRWMPVTVLDVAELMPDPVMEPEPVQHWPAPPDWHKDALCAVANPTAIDPWFFGVDDEDRPALPPAMLRRAREICEVCPARARCLLTALVEDERFGVWGGTTGRQRTLMRKALKEQRVTIPELLLAYG